MEQPTDVQVREFWEWCGFKRQWTGCNCSMCRSYMLLDDAVVDIRTLPLDLNNLFKYAVPKAMKDDWIISMVSLSPTDNFRWWFDNYQTRKSHNAEAEDPALALFWALWEVMKEVVHE